VQEPAGHEARHQHELLLPSARGDAAEGAEKLTDGVGKEGRELLPHVMGQATSAARAPPSAKEGARAACRQVRGRGAMGRVQG
jgi:hypothetical protein